MPRQSENEQTYEISDASPQTHKQINDALDLFPFHSIASHRRLSKHFVLLFVASKIENADSFGSRFESVA